MATSIYKATMDSRNYILYSKIRCTISQNHSNFVDTYKRLISILSFSFLLINCIYSCFYAFFNNKNRKNLQRIKCQNYNDENEIWLRDESEVADNRKWGVFVADSDVFLVIRIAIKLSGLYFYST